MTASRARPHADSSQITEKLFSKESDSRQSGGVTFASARQWPRALLLCLLNKVLLKYFESSVLLANTVHVQYLLQS